MNKRYWWTTKKRNNNYEELLFWLNRKVDFKLTVQTHTGSDTFFIFKNSTFEVEENSIHFKSGIYYQSISTYELILRSSQVLFKDRLRDIYTFTFKELTEEDISVYKIIE